MDLGSDVGSKSPTSSPSSSVFSYDAASSQSSATSVSSSLAGGVWDSDDTTSTFSTFSRLATLSTLPGLARSTSNEESVVRRLSDDYGSITHRDNLASSKELQPRGKLPISERQHPRRTRPQSRVHSQNGCLETSNSRPPPSLVRQDVRKDNFVDGLVDTTTQTIETIWPLSKTCPGNANVDQKLIPLRTFVQEVLKRSRTSYSTLLVALHYLVLVMAAVPKYGDFTMEQIEDSEGCRAMQCGRRMFLAALVLASKYLQDRNYSTRAWGKISGLQVSEINTNERVFLSAVNWKLHIPEPLFQRWERIVLKYSPSASPSKTPRSCPTPCRTWQSIIPQLNSELDQFDDKGTLISDNDSGYYSSSSRASSRDSSPHAIRTAPDPAPLPEAIPIEPIAAPRFLEPTPCETKPGSQMLPPLQPREGPLPTPTFTPRHPALCTPAVSASGLLPRTSSMAMAMAQGRKFWDESLLDRRDTFSPTPLSSNPLWLRRVSHASSILSKSSSSPDSFVWDQSKNPSRSSSISSVASSASATSKPDLAWQAMLRSANMQSSIPTENELTLKESSSGHDMSWKNPFPFMPAKAIPSCGTFRLDVPAERSTPSPPELRKQSFEEQPTPSTLSDETTPRPTRSYTPKEDVPCQKTYDAAVTLRKLDLERKSQFSACSQPTFECRPRKRERPLSMDITVQSSVRDIIGPYRQGYLCQKDNEEAVVLPDNQTADSSFLQCDDNVEGNGHSKADHGLRWLAVEETCKNRERPEHVVYPDRWSSTDSTLSSGGIPRKKTCIPAVDSEPGQIGLSVRQGGGNTPSSKAVCAAYQKGQLLRGEKLTPQLRSSSQGVGLKQDQPLLARTFNEVCPKTAGAELERMLRVSIGQCDDIRPALRGGRLWGEIA